MSTKKVTLSPQEISRFQRLIYDYYTDHERYFSWRITTDPYKIVVSEIMLQQTQTGRVVSKFEQFIQTFPDWSALAKASVAEVIAAWQGLGYNRRALALKAFAERIINECNGSLPQDPEVLVTFRGIGPATASSICAFAFKRPTVFIETNIRSVFIHQFFAHQQEVHDKDIMPLIAQTLDFENPRIWYYALMDYGVMLKKKHKNPSRKSRHHAQQSKFEGSDRQVRGAILKMLVSDKNLSYASFIKEIPREEKKIHKILLELEKEGFIQEKKGYYSLGK